jgi:hypothetical protein
MDHKTLADFDGVEKPYGSKHTFNKLIVYGQAFIGDPILLRECHSKKCKAN